MFCRVLRAAGSFDDVLPLTERLLRAGAWPNKRFFDEVMRACLRGGHSGRALSVFILMGAAFDVAPHASSRALALEALVMALRRRALAPGDEAQPPAAPIEAQLLALLPSPAVAPPPPPMGLAPEAAQRLRLLDAAYACLVFERDAKDHPDARAQLSRLGLRLLVDWAALDTADGARFSAAWRADVRAARLRAQLPPQALAAASRRGDAALAAAADAAAAAAAPGDEAATRTAAEVNRRADAVLVDIVDAQKAALAAVGGVGGKSGSFVVLPALPPYLPLAPVSSADARRACAMLARRAEAVLQGMSAEGVVPGPSTLTLLVDAALRANAPERLAALCEQSAASAVSAAAGAAAIDAALQRACKLGPSAAAAAPAAMEALALLASGAGYRPSALTLVDVTRAATESWLARQAPVSCPACRSSITITDEALDATVARAPLSAPAPPQRAPVPAALPHQSVQSLHHPRVRREVKTSEAARENILSYLATHEGGGGVEPEEPSPLPLPPGAAAAAAAARRGPVCRAGRSPDSPARGGGAGSEAAPAATIAPLVSPSQQLHLLRELGLLEVLPDAALASLLDAAARVPCAREAWVAWAAARARGVAAAHRPSTLAQLLRAFVAGGLRAAAWEAFMLLSPRHRGPLPSYKDMASFADALLASANVGDVAQPPAAQAQLMPLKPAAVSPPLHCNEPLVEQSSEVAAAAATSAEVSAAVTSGHEAPVAQAEQVPEAAGAAATDAEAAAALLATLLPRPPRQLPRQRLRAVHELASGVSLVPYPHTTQCLVLAEPALGLHASVLAGGGGATTSLDTAALLFINEDAPKRLCRAFKARALVSAAWPAAVSAQRTFRLVAALSPAGADVSRRRYFAQIEDARRLRGLPPLAGDVAAAALDARSVFTLLNAGEDAVARAREAGLVVPDGGGDAAAAAGAPLVAHVYVGLVPYDPLPSGNASRIVAHEASLRALFDGDGGIDARELLGAFRTALLASAQGGVLALGGGRGSHPATAMLLSLKDLA